MEDWKLGESEEDFFSSSSYYPLPSRSGVYSDRSGPSRLSPAWAPHLSGIETPELETPELETPELETPELETPELGTSRTRNFHRVEDEMILLPLIERYARWILPILIESKTRSYRQLNIEVATEMELSIQHRAEGEMILPVERRIAR